MAKRRFNKRTTRVIVTLTAVTLLLCSALLLVKNDPAEPDVEPGSPSPSPSPEAQPLFKVVLDPGHGAPDGGAVGNETGTAEAGINLSYALAIKAELEALQIAVTLTRQGEDALHPDKKKDMAARRDIINGADADAVISVHMNKFRDRSISGPMAFYTEGSAQGEALAKAVLDGVCTAIERPLRHVNPEKYYILEQSEPPAIILECGFLSNARDEALLLSDEHKNALAKGAAQGIFDYLSGQGAQ